MKIISIILTVTFVLFSSGTAVWAASEKFTLNTSNTYVGFEVSYLLLMQVTGHFNDFQGTLIVDRERPENSHAILVVKTTSVDAGNESRNRDIRGPALFNTDQYPEMIFHSDKIEIGQDNKGLITGYLTLLGVTRPVTMDLIRIPDMRRQNSVNNDGFSDGFMATGKIKRSHFGMNKSSGAIGNVVTLFFCYKLEECNDASMQPKETEPQYNQ